MRRVQECVGISAQSGRLLIYENQPGDFRLGAQRKGALDSRLARNRRRGDVIVVRSRRLGRRQSLHVPEPVVGQRRRGRAQVPHMRLHRIRQKNRLGICGKNIRAE